MVKFLIESNHMGASTAAPGDEIVLADGSSVTILALPRSPDFMRNRIANEIARGSATQSHEGYLATIDSLEPDISTIDAGAFYASASISLKRIADLMEAHETRVVEFYTKRDNPEF